MTLSYPSHLVPVELEKELVSGALRAAWILDERPDHRGAIEALDALASFDVRDLAFREHREIVAAVQSLHGTIGTFSPALVRDELRVRQQFDAMAMLPSLVGWGLAPVAALPTHIRKIRTAARGRRRFRRAQSVQAKLCEKATTS